MVGLGVLSSAALTPDLDMGRSVGVIALAPSFVKKAWVTAWSPYARLFKHRGISHKVGLGTLTRLMYLSPLLFFTGINWWWVLGLMLGDTLHILLDYTT